MMLRLTRRYRFCASHRLHSDALSDEENRALYGKCNNPWGHGHDYVLEVSVAGEVDARTGRLVSVDALDTMVNEAVIEPFDHRSLNIDVAVLDGAVATSENLVRDIERRLRAAWPARFGESAAALDGIRLRETKRNSFETRR